MGRTSRPTRERHQDEAGGKLRTSARVAGRRRQFQRANQAPRSPTEPPCIESYGIYLGRGVGVGLGRGGVGAGTGDGPGVGVGLGSGFLAVGIDASDGCSFDRLSS